MHTLFWVPACASKMTHNFFKSLAAFQIHFDLRHPAGQTVVCHAVVRGGNNVTVETSVLTFDLPFVGECKTQFPTRVMYCGSY
mmetsp:Transcript_159747/g.387908  ORF Transcript_159747/g.387908 Transcript_159747/m.387908 type:complete len:83 (-) Transcript_159747:347-595(-)